MRSSRKIAVASGVVGGLLVLAGLCLVFVVPEVVRAQIASRISERAGLPCEIGKALVSPGQIVLEDVRIGEPGEALFAELHRVTLHADLLTLLSSGADAVHLVTVSEGSIAIDLSNSIWFGCLAPSSAAAQQSPVEAPAVSGSDRQRTIALESVSLEVRDGEGLLGRAAALDLSVGRDFHVVANAVEVAPAPSPVLRIARLELGGSRIPRMLSSLLLDTVEIHESEAQTTDSVLARVRAITDHLRGRTPSGVERDTTMLIGSSDDSDISSDADPDPTQDDTSSLDVSDESVEGEADANWEPRMARADPQQRTASNGRTATLSAEAVERIAEAARGASTAQGSVSGQSSVSGQGSPDLATGNGSDPPDLVGIRSENDGSSLANGSELLGASDGYGSAGSRSEDPILSWLAESFHGEVQNLSVQRLTSSGERELLSNLQMTLDRQDGQTFRTSGSGRPEGSGELAWQLQVEPAALRADGTVTLHNVSAATLAPFAPGLPLYEPENAHVTAQLDIDGDSNELRAVGELVVRDLAIESPRLAPAPVRAINLHVRGEARFLRAQHRLELSELTVEAGAARLQLTGHVEFDDEHYLADLEADLPRTTCNDVLAAIPADLLQEAQAFEFAGRMSAHVAVQIDSRDLDATALNIRISNGCRFQLVPAMADLTRFDAPFIHRVEEPDGQTMVMTTGPGSDAWTPIASISPFMLHAVLAHEDGGFFSHHGFSPGSIREALVRNLRAGRYVMGASTISMQLVKNVFLRREKTVARKLQEVFLTWWIESAMSKDRILELYLNVIEYGPGVYGIRHAAEHYFGIEPRSLSAAQAAYLASILPNPKAYHDSWERDELSASWRNRIGRFLRHMAERDRIDSVALSEGLHELDNLDFHHPGEPRPEPPLVLGRTSPLPIAIASWVDDEEWDALAGVSESALGTPGQATPLDGDSPESVDAMSIRVDRAQTVDILSP